MLIVITTILVFFILLPSDLVDYGQSLVACELFFSNIFFWKDSGYFAATSQLKPLLHTWSLAVEEQFYLFAPIALVLLYRYARRWWLPILMLPMILSFAASVASVFAAPTAGFFVLPTRAWELLLGAVIAYQPRARVRHPLTAEITALLGLALIVYALATLTSADPFPGWNAALPCLGATLIILAGTADFGGQSTPLVNRLLAARPIVFVGLISYSLYLIHWPIAAFSRYLLLREPTLAETIAMIVLSFVLAVASWKFIEQPIRHLPSSSRWPVFLGAGGVIIAGVAVGLVTIELQGLPGRFPDFTERHISGTEMWGGDHCFNQNQTQPSEWDPVRCTRIHGKNGRILLWGDSFAAQYAPGILQDSERIDADVLQYTFAGCPPILAYYSYARVGCAPFNRRVLEIIREQHIDTVVMAGRWTDTPARTLDHISETVDQLRASGVQVYVIGQSPEFSADVQHIDYLSGSRMRPGVATWTVFFNDAVNDRIARQSMAAHFVNPLLYLCQDRKCPYRDGDDYLYSDYGHFSASGSLRAVQSYFPAGARGS